MKLVTNSVAPNKVRETADAWIIEDVPFVRPMELSGGYVPRANIKETARQWEGVPATLNHPRNEYGEPVAAGTQPETHVGVVESPSFDGEYVRGDMRINKADINNTEGAGDIQRALESGQHISVSSQYAAAPAEPGEYDGEYRQNVERIIRPDSVAILPNQPGQCSIEDGCGINPQMVANSDLTIPMTQNQTDGEDGPTAEFEVGDLVRWSTQASPGTGRVAEVVTTPGERVTSEADVDNPPERIATEDEAVYKLDDWTGDGFTPGQVVKSASEMLGPWESAPDEAMSANMDVPDKYRFDNPGEAVEMAQELGFEGAGDEVIHPHGEGDDTVFMPGPSHDALVEMLMEMDEMSANQMDMELTDVMPSDVNTFTDEEWDGSAATAAMPNPSEDEDAAAVLDMAHLVHPTGEEARGEKANWKLPFREGPDSPVNTRALVAAKAAVRGARDGVDDMSEDMRDAVVERIDDMLVEAPDDLFGSMGEDMESEGGHMGEEDMSENAFAHIGRKVAGALGIASGGASAVAANSTETMPAESGADSDPEPEPMLEDKDKIEELAANTEFDRESLEKWDGTNCLQRLYESRMLANDDTDADAESNTNTMDITKDELNELIDERAQEIVANRQEESKKDELATDIVANSAEYDDTETVKEDYPTVAALKTLKESVTDSTPAMPGRGTQTANTGGEDEYPDMEFN